MKNKFTKISLLIAIIVIIFIICVPIILNKIETKRVESVKEKALEYISIVEMMIRINGNDNYDNDDIVDGTYTNFTELYNIYGFGVMDNIPTSGWIKIVDGEVTDSSFMMNGYTIDYSKQTKDVVVIKGDNIKELP